GGVWQTPCAAHDVAMNASARRRQLRPVPAQRLVRVEKGIVAENVFAEAVHPGVVVARRQLDPRRGAWAGVAVDAAYVLAEVVMNAVEAFLPVAVGLADRRGDFVVRPGDVAAEFHGPGLLP